MFSFQLLLLLNWHNNPTSQYPARTSIHKPHLVWGNFPHPQCLPQCTADIWWWLHLQLCCSEHTHIATMISNNWTTKPTQHQVAANQDWASPILLEPQFPTKVWEPRPPLISSLYRAHSLIDIDSIANHAIRKPSCTGNFINSLWSDSN